MAWCPQCKEEYEEHIKMCGDCNVPLVESLEDIVRERMLLVLNTEEEARKAKEFLEYSSIDSASVRDTKNEHGEHIWVLGVKEEDWEKSSKLIQGFLLSEKQEPNEEEFYFDEYDTIDIEGESELAEIKSSYMSFLVLGGIIAVVGLINLLGFASFMNGNMPMVFTVIGIVFFFIGIFTKGNMKNKIEGLSTIQEEFDTVFKWYEEEYPIAEFYVRHKVDLADMDDGAKYFALMDLIVKECETYDKTIDEKLKNTVAEKVYHQL